MQQLDVLRLLRDGQRHSGEALAKSLGLTRAAVWKHVTKLGQWGLRVESVRGRGYRLSRPIELLDREAVLAAIPRELVGRVASLEVFAELDSTSHHLLEAAPPAPGELAACLAEYQHAGRGRRGRRWTSPFGGGLCLSVGWLFEEMPPQLGALGLAAAVVTRRVLEEMTGYAPLLKWPNDLVWDDRKLGGILVELSAECQGNWQVVIGIGLNVAIDTAWLRAASDWPGGAVDLDGMTAGRPPSRNVLAGRLIRAMHELLSDYRSGGFEPYHRDFVEADYLRGRRVELLDGSSRVGRALTIDPDGALVLETEAGPQRVISGDVSLRAA